jgi:hypothetical protein
MADQYGQPPYIADPNGAAGQFAGAGPHGAGPYGGGPYEAGQPGGPQFAGQFGPNMRNTGSWQAAGQQPGANPRTTGSWQAAGPGFSADPRSAGVWQDTGPGPGQGQGWAPGPGGGHGGRNTGSWQAAGPQQQAGWAPSQGQFGQGIRNTGSWQAAGAVPGQGWPGPGQQPHPGQPYPGQPYSGQPYPAAGGPGMRNTGGFSHVGSPVIRQRDSALPDPPPGAKGPIAAIETDNIAAFARDLRVLRSRVGLDYPDMAEKSHYTMRTLASAAGGLRLPTLPVLIAYVNACGGDVADWEERWGRLTKSGKRAQEALPVGEQQPAGQPGQGQIPQSARQTGEIYVITSARQRDAQW